MDFRVVGGLEAFLGKEGGANSCQVQEHQTKAKGLGSGFCKQERSHSHGSGEDDHRSSKMARTDEFLAPKTMPLHQGTPLLRSNSLLSDEAEGRSKQHMLSFSSVKSEPPLPSKDGGLLGRTTQGKVSVSSPYYHHTPALYSRNAGLGSGSLNTNMHGAFPGVRGPFTPSQWIELEHQALIYKYLNANVPVPSNLLIPIKKAFNPFGLSGSSGLSIPPNSLAWNSFHLGFAGNNTDPEPGRCRRTDGKKWRCSRDAVADQKYCERHINRGRHRSRKPVEGQNGHAVSGTTSSKVTPMASSLPTASVITNGGGSNSLAIAAQQLKSLHTGVASTDPHLNRRQDTRALSISSPTINMKSRDGPFSILKHQNPFEDSSQSEFGFVSSDSLLNPSQKNSYTNGKSYGSSFLNFSGQESQDQHTLRQFMEDWPKQDQSNRSGISWPEELKSDWTQLSMSIPMTASDFSSSSSSPAHEKLGLSPLRLSREVDPVQMGLGVSSDFNEPSQKHTNWIPISWGTEMGGPLGEVLHSSKSTFGACKNSSSALNLMSEGWDGSPHFESSPTGVLQKANFGSLSNSSTSGSSPRAENKRIYEGANICEGVLASTMTNNSLSIPSL